MSKRLAWCFALCVWLQWPGSASADIRTLSWDDPHDASIASYTVYWGTASGAYTHVVDVGRVFSWVRDLAPGATYYFTVEAVNTAGAHSAKAAEVTTTIPNTATCSYSLSPTSATLSRTAQSSSFQLTTTSACAWTATAAGTSWVTVQTSSGTGSGTVAFSVTANAGTSARTGTITAGGRTFTVTQAAADPQLTVTLQPTAAVTAGARWRVDGGTWRASGTSVTVSAGSHTVSFLDLTGWLTPASQAVSVASATSLVGTYQSVADWMALYGVTDMTADDDGDGVDNTAEFTAGTDPTIPNTWHLAEGATGFFRQRIALANPGIAPAEVTISFLREGLSPLVRDYTVPALSRRTLQVNDIPGLEDGAVSADLTTRLGGVVVERTMTWGGEQSVDSGHTGKALPNLSSQWYFAEGDARAFDTYLTFNNGQASDVTARITYLLETGATVRDTCVLPAASRRTLHANTVPGLSDHAFSVTVSASAPIMVERSMYMNAGGEFWKIGHESAGATAPATSWFVAEGRTGPFFDEYLTIANPNAAPVEATLRFLRPNGPVITQRYGLGASSRTTILVDGVPGLEDTDVSVAVAATLPVVVERSMYWAGNWQQWYEGHNTVAVTTTGTKWALAEGETGGALNVQSYVLLANPSNSDAQVTVTILRESGDPVVFGTTVRANSRVTIDSASLPLASGEKFGVVVESTNGVGIVVERSMYWDSARLFWSAGTAETAVRIR